LETAQLGFDTPPSFPYYSLTNFYVAAVGSPNIYFTTGCWNDAIVNIPDDALLYALIDEGVDTDNDSLISYYEAEVTFSLDLNAGNITDITPIRAFLNLDSLKLQNNHLIFNLDWYFNLKRY